MMFFQGIPYQRRFSLVDPNNETTCSVLTTSLFLGHSIFDNRLDKVYHQSSQDAILEAATECNLEELESGPDWAHVDSLAKSFIKKLLILEEEKRLEVDNALRHLWLNQGNRSNELQQEYDKALSSWEPRLPKADFKEDLAIFMDPLSTKAEVRTSISCMNSLLESAKLGVMPPPEIRRTSKRSRLDAISENLVHQSPYFPTSNEKEAAIAFSDSCETTRDTIQPGEVDHFDWGDEDYDLRKHIAQERRGFWPAKAFAEAIREKKELHPYR